MFYRWWHYGLVALGFSLLSTSQAADIPKNILIIHAYSQEYDWTKRQHLGFMAALEQSGSKPVISTEYLDTKRVNYTPAYAQFFDQMLSNKYANYQPDLIYTTDDNATEFALDWLSKRYPQTPIIFSGVNNYALLNRLDSTHHTGAFEKKDIAANLNLIKQLNLHHHGMLLIGDDSTTDRAIMQEVKTILISQTDMQVRTLSNSRFSRLVDEVKQAPETLLMLTTIGGWKDDQDKPIPLSDSIKMLTAVKPYVFAMEDGYIVSGVLGGHVTSGYDQGLTAGKIAFAHLSGTPIKSLPPLLASPNATMLDAQAFANKQIRIPDGLLDHATLLNPIPSFYEREKRLILISFYLLLTTLLIGAAISVFLLMRKNKQLAHTQKQAQAASLAKSEFLGSMSHELRTPLNAILGFSQLIHLDPETNNDNKDYAHEIERAGTHLLSLVNDLIDLSRIESGQLEVRLAATPLSTLLNEVFQLVTPLAEKYKVRLLLDQPNEEILLNVDPLRLKQIIINLISNGIKYNRMHGHVHIHTQLDDMNLRILITDTGLGIPKEKQKRLFNAFDRLGAEGGTIEGTGIGLVITKKLLEAMDGTIGFESVEQQGSTFWVDFAIAERRPRTEPLISSSPNEPKKPASTITTRAHPLILCIEDNPINAKFIEMLFKKKPNYQLVLTANAGEGLMEAMRSQPDLILSDIQLPDFDGYTLLSRLKANERTRDIPVIALTAEALSEEVQHGKAAGFVDYLTKPIQIDQLFSTIEKHVKRS